MKQYLEALADFAEVVFHSYMRSGDLKQEILPNYKDIKTISDTYGIRLQQVEKDFMVEFQKIMSKWMLEYANRNNQDGVAYINLENLMNYYQENMVLH